MWGDSCLQARLSVGPILVTVLQVSLLSGRCSVYDYHAAICGGGADVYVAQDCSQADCAKMVLSLAAVGSYWGSKEVPARPTHSPAVLCRVLTERMPLRSCSYRARRCIFLRVLETVRC